MLSCSNDTTSSPALVTARERILAVIGPMILETGASRPILLESIVACGWSAALVIEDSGALDEIAAACALLSCYSSDPQETQEIGESLYWWAVERTDDAEHEIETARTDGAGRRVTRAARQYARELRAGGLS